VELYCCSGRIHLFCTLCVVRYHTLRALSLRPALTMSESECVAGNATWHFGTPSPAARRPLPRPITTNADQSSERGMLLLLSPPERRAREYRQPAVAFRPELMDGMRRRTLLRIARSNQRHSIIFHNQIEPMKNVAPQVLGSCGERRFYLFCNACRAPGDTTARSIYSTQSHGAFFFCIPSGRKYQSEMPLSGYFGVRSL
jgi:hypothetical protein